MTVISALQLLKQRDHGDPFASFGGGLNWTGRSHGYEGGLGAYQTIGDADYERDAEEISIPRHFTGQGQMHGRNRNSQQSGSFMTTSSRSGSVKSSRTGSGYNVELGTNSTGGGYHGSSHNYGSPATTGAVSVGGSNATRDDRRDKVGQNISEDEADESDNRDTSPYGGTETRENK
ncbi:hypothetical protein BGZ76_011862 [Entomortierella beljakovae]|nr:hypothetical protein BGZ76_011862 [Entomortierella beljakovae]